jgi:hypothetical protein
MMSSSSSISLSITATFTDSCFFTILVRFINNQYYDIVLTVSYFFKI